MQSAFLLFIYLFFLNRNEQFFIPKTLLTTYDNIACFLLLFLPLQVMMMGNTPLAHLLLEYGADPNVPDPGTGSSPLHDAARTGFMDTLRLLIRFNADPNATDHSNLRPVDVARQTGHMDVVEFLSRI